MPIAFYIIPYISTVFAPDPTPVKRAERTLAIEVDAPSLAGQWREVEVLGNRAVVKINASLVTLTQLDLAYKRLPKDALQTSLSDLSGAQKTALKNELGDMGYTFEDANRRFLGDAETDALLGQGMTHQQIFNTIDLGNYTLGDVVRFMATRKRLALTVDFDTQTITFDGDTAACESIDALDKEIT